MEFRVTKSSDSPYQIRCNQPVRYCVSDSIKIGDLSGFSLDVVYPFISDKPRKLFCTQPRIGFSTLLSEVFLPWLFTKVSKLYNYFSCAMSEHRAMNYDIKVD